MSSFPAQCEEGDEDAISTVTDVRKPASQRGVSRWRAPIYLWFPLAIFACTRLVDAVFFVVASRRQLALAPGDYPGYFVHTAHPADPGYFALTTNWDGQWYEFIATQGYQNPGLDSGNAADQAWAWAFPPGYPLLIRLVMGLSGLSFPVATTVVNLLLGAVALVLLFRLLERSGGTFVAACGVALWSCFVSAPLFQTAYSESLAACLLLASLLALRNRRYWGAALAVGVLSFTRIITPPLALVVVAHAAWRHRKGDRLSRSEWVGLGATGILALTGVFHWTWVASLLAGQDVALARTQVLAQHRFEWFAKTYEAVGWTGPAFTMACIAVVALFAASERSSALGLENRVWLAAYVTYLAVVTQVHSGILRYLLLAPTFGIMLMGGVNDRPTRGRVAAVALICMVGLVLQYWWISRSFVFASGVTLVP